MQCDEIVVTLNTVFIRNINPVVHDVYPAAAAAAPHIIRHTHSHHCLTHRGQEERNILTAIYRKTVVRGY